MSSSRRWIIWSRASSARLTNRLMSVGVDLGSATATVTAGETPVPAAVAPAAPATPAFGDAVRRGIEAISVPAAAFAVALLLFGIFIAITGRNPFAVYYQMLRGSFGTWFSFQNTLL